MNKRGNVLDWFFILAILFMTGIVILVSYMIVDTVDSTNLFADNAVAQDAINRSKSTILNFDNLMLFVIVGLSIFVLASSAVVYTHPAFFIVGVLLLFIAVVVAGVVSNTFWILTNSSAIAATAALFPKITFLMNKLPLYVLFMGIAGVVVSYIADRRF